MSELDKYKELLVAMCLDQELSDSAFLFNLKIIVKKLGNEVITESETEQED